MLVEVDSVGQEVGGQCEHTPYKNGVGREAMLNYKLTYSNKVISVWTLSQFNRKYR